MGTGAPTARAVVLDAPGRLSEIELPIPPAGNDDAVLRVEACGLCGTDHEQFTGALPAPGRFVPGHEAVGVIDEIGAGAASRWQLGVGDRVAVEVFQSCRSCRPCVSGDYRHCVVHGMADMYGFIPVDRPPGLWGGYASHLYLSPDAMVLPVPSSIDPAVATLFNPVGAGIRWGVTVPETKEGDVVAVLGPGIRGLSVAAAAKDAGAGCVLVTGKGPNDALRLDLATKFGADIAVDVEQQDPVDVLLSSVGALADIVVDVTARAPQALGQAVALARPGGTVVLAGTRGSTETPGFNPDLIVYKELRLLGALGVDAPAYRAALDLLEARRYPFEELPRTSAPLQAGAVGRLLSSMSDPGPGSSRPIHALVAP